jgi:uncharacterized protein (DUF2225 family)
MSANLTLVRQKLKVLLGKDDLVEKYVREFGTDINIRNIKAVKSSTQAARIDPSSGQGHDPTFKILVRCPVCQQANITCHEIKAKSQKLSFDRFMTPKYTGAPGFKTVDYSRISVTVCPRCFFASPDKKDFVTYSVTARAETKPQLGPMVINRLSEETSTRKTIMGSVSDPEDYFTVPRTTEAVIMSYRLAIARALVEAEMDRPNAHYKAGAYALKIAMLFRDEKQSDEKYLKEALKHLSNCFSSSSVPSQDLENQVIYIIVALCLRLGDEKQARAFINVLEKIKADLLLKKKENPLIKTGSVESWLNKSKDLWEDRELPDLWDH